MSVVRTVTAVLSGDRGSQWLPVGLRAVAAVVLLPAGLLKFIDYGPQAVRFAELGVPIPEVMVVVVGVVELVAALGLAVGVATRTAAFVTVPIMLGTVVYFRLVPSNAVVLLASLGILVFGPGRYTVWNPEPELLRQLR